jgi:integrase
MQGKEMSKSFERKADAERHLVDMQHRLLTGTYAPPRLGRTPFSEVALRYRQRGNWRPRTHRTVEERLRYAIAHFGDRPIASIRKGDVQSFVSGLPLAPNTVRVVMQHVSGVFNTALDDGLLGGRNPCDGVRLPRVDAPPIFPMSIEQVDALLTATSEPFKAAIVIGAGLGLRQSEAAGLTVDRVDFLRRSITIDRQWQQATGSGAGRSRRRRPRRADASCRPISGCSTTWPRTSNSTASAPTVCSSTATACRSTRPSSATSCEPLVDARGCPSRSRSTTFATSSRAR